MPSLSALSEASKVTSDFESGALGENVNDGAGVPLGGRMMPGGTRRMLTDRDVGGPVVGTDRRRQIWMTVWVSTESAGASGAV